MNHGSLFSGIGGFDLAAEEMGWNNFLKNKVCICKLYYICIMGRKRKPIYEEAYQMYLEGLSLEQVGAEIGVSRQCVYKAFKRRGFTLRGVNFRPYQIYDGKKFTLRDNGYYALTTDDRCLMHRYVWQKERGKIPENWDIHHINGQKSDNRIENLECLPKEEHTRKYSPHNNQYTKGRKRDSHRTI